MVSFLMFFILSLAKSLILIIMVMVGIAFFTLFEQKILGYLQERKGPNKTGMKGILQPFADAVKLFLKDESSPFLKNSFVFFVSPMFALWVMLVIWISFPLSFGQAELSLSVLFILCCLASMVFMVFGAGWASNSKYALIGSLRAMVQTISYEVSFILILLSFIMLMKSFDLGGMTNWGVWFIFIAPPLALVWFISLLAEASRAPFDFSEGESELVSGFNTEYSSGPFAMFFLAEYGMIFYLSVLFSVVFLGGLESLMFLLWKVGLVIMLFIWIRGSLPRLRYDKLMSLAWLVFLPVSLAYLIWFSGITSMVA